MEGMEFLEFRRVYKIYHNGVRALTNINLSVREGEFVFLLGPTGAGKSTVMKLLSREEVPSAGDVWLDGFRVNRLEDDHLPYLRRNMGIVFQDLRLLPMRTVFENLVFPLEVMGLRRTVMNRYAREVLEVLDLEEKRNHLVEWLSGGEKQKLCVGRAVIHQPKLVLADEPTGNLDGHSAYEMVSGLFQLCREGGSTVVMATHNERILKAFPGRRVYLDRGEIVRDSFRE